MAKKVTSNEVAVAVSTQAIAAPRTKEEVPQVLEALRAQLKALKGDVKDSISLDVEYEGVCIKDVDTVKELITISMAIRNKSKIYDEELAFYNLTGKVEPFNPAGKTPEQWYQIIEKAKNELINKKQIKNLEETIKELSQFEDENTKLARKLEEITSKASQLIQ